MKVVVAVTSGTEDPTRATLGILAAKAAAERGHEVIVWLQGEGVVLANRNVYPTVQGVNMPPMKDALEFLLDAGVPLWVCEACGKARDVHPDNWVATASYKGMGEYMDAVIDAERHIDF